MPSKRLPPPRPSLGAPFAPSSSAHLCFPAPSDTELLSASLLVTQQAVVFAPWNICATRPFQTAATLLTSFALEIGARVDQPDDSSPWAEFPNDRSPTLLQTLAGFQSDKSSRWNHTVISANVENRTLWSCTGKTGSPLMTAVPPRSISLDIYTRACFSLFSNER